MTSFVLSNGWVINPDSIINIDVSGIEDLVIVVTHISGELEVTGIQAIELLMAMRPAVFEGKRLRWKRHAWALHNLVGHPLMQVLAFCHQYKLAMWVHDITVPRPLGRK